MSIRSLSDLLNDLSLVFTKEKISVNDLIIAFHERGFGFFLFFFALPAALPLPGLGINTLIALPLLILTFQIAMGRENIWMPQSIQKKEFQKKTLDKWIAKSMPFIKAIEYFIKPRMGFLTQKGVSNIVGVAAFVMAIYVAIPLPLTNTVPSFGLALIGIGLMMRDGLAILGGLLIGLLWIALLTFALIFLGMEGAEIIKNFVTSWGNLVQ
ncbi:MAG: exopolysaccharide biosynthesis protein [Pseudomonadota bacterium]